MTRDERRLKLARLYVQALADGRDAQRRRRARVLRRIICGPLVADVRAAEWKQAAERAVV